MRNNCTHSGHQRRSIRPWHVATNVDAATRLRRAARAALDLKHAKTPKTCTCTPHRSPVAAAARLRWPSCALEIYSEAQGQRSLTAAATRTFARGPGGLSQNCIKATRRMPLPLRRPQDRAPPARRDAAWRQHLHLLQRAMACGIGVASLGVWRYMSSAAKRPPRMARPTGGNPCSATASFCRPLGGSHARCASASPVFIGLCALPLPLAPILL